MSNVVTLVYTVGKVASTSISTSLIEQGVPCYDIHNLMEPAIMLELETSVAASRLPPAHIGTSIAILNDFKNTANRIKIITCFRDSLSRNISAIFQNLPYEASSMSLDEVRARVEKTNPDKTGAWMRKEFEPATGINLISAGFDPVQKHGLFTQGRFEVLMLRTDLDDTAKERLISEFVGQAVTLRRSNDGSKKWYSELYEQFKMSGKISGAWIDECLNSAFMQVFYTPEELSIFKRKAEHWRDDA